MTGWSTVTVRPDWDEIHRLDAPVDTEVQTRVMEWCETRDLWAESCQYYEDVVVQIGGYRDWTDDERLFEAVGDLWESAVVIQANDTGDVGHAKYYEPAEEDWWQYDVGEPVCIDEFEERELAHGRPVGEKAAAYMLLHHDVFAMSTLTRPYEFTFEQTPVVDDD